MTDRHISVTEEAGFPAVNSTWRLAVVLAFVALACGVLLGGLSAWFLGSVAIAGLSAAAFTFNFHIPAALIRLFAVGRTAARYGERLLGHKAALRDQLVRRVQLFGAMAAAPGVRRIGWQLGDQARLADYLDDVEDLDYAKLRVDLPVMTLGFGLLACVAATLVMAPLAMLPITALFLAILAVGRRMAKAGAMAWRTVRALRRDGARALGAAMASAIPLKGEGAWRSRCGDALASFSDADERLLELRRMQARFDVLAGLAGPLAALGVIGGAYAAGARSEALLAPAFLAFAWIALAEGLQGASRILFAQLRRRAAQAEIDGWLGAASQNAPQPRRRQPAKLTLSDLTRRAPDGRALDGRLSMSLEAGRATVLVGASGSGKTSLLKQIAGWIGDDVSSGDAGPLTAAERQALCLYCPHDAAVLADTVRANLFAPSAPDEQLWRALEAVEMRDRVERAGGLDGWITQDVLSLGEAQRLNLARAWLSDKRLMLLDEPTEHLDGEQARRILARLLDRLGDRIVVLSSHRPPDRRHAATIRL